MNTLRQKCCQTVSLVAVMNILSCNLLKELLRSLQEIESDFMEEAKA